MKRLLLFLTLAMTATGIIHTTNEEKQLKEDIKTAKIRVKNAEELSLIINSVWISFMASRSVLFALELDIKKNPTLFSNRGLLSICQIISGTAAVIANVYTLFAKKALRGMKARLAKLEAEKATQS